MSSTRGGGSRGARAAQGSTSHVPTMASRGSSNYPSRDNSHGTRRANHAARSAPSFTTRRNTASSRGGAGGNGLGRGNAFDKPQSPAKKGLGGDALPTGNWQEREQKLKVHREQEKKDAIARGLMSDPDVQTKLENAITLVGTCQDMCPEHERVRRVVQRGLWDEERDEDGKPDESRMVKIFRRSAAGDEVQLPSDLRPPPVLKRVCDYLFNDLVGAHELSEIHHFVWDRTRAVRNDFSIQQLSKLDDLAIAIECYERIARFHIMSLHQLAVAPQPYPQYSPGQEKEQLDRTLLSLMQYYDDTRGRLELKNEAEFRSYCVVLQLKDPIVDLEDRIQAWPRSISRDHRVRTALEVYAAASHIKEPKGPMNPQLRPVIARQDWASFWKLIESRKTSYLLACVAEVHFNIVREQMLNAIIRTARRRTAKDGRVPPDTEWRINELQLLFNFNNDVELREYVGRWGLVFQQSPDADDEFLDIRHIAGRPLPAETKAGPTQLRSELVELKRHDRTYPAIIDGMNVRTAREAGMIMQFPEDAEDAEDKEDSLFVHDNKPTNTALQTPSTSVSVEAPPSIFGLADGGFSFGAPSNTNVNQPYSTFGQSSGGLGFGSPSNSHITRTSPFGLPSTTPVNDGSNPFKPQSAEHAEAKRETTKNPFAIFSSPAVSGNHSTDISTKTNPFALAPLRPATTDFGKTKAGNTDHSVAEYLSEGNASTSTKPVTITTIDMTGNSVVSKSKTVKSGPFIEDPGSSPPSPASLLDNPASVTFEPSSSNLQTTPDIKTFDDPAATHGTTLGQPTDGSQFESTPKWPPSQQPTQSHASASTANNPSQSSHSIQNATVSSPSPQTARRPSSASWEINKPKKPSPLSNSFTASPEVTPPGFTSPALESARGDVLPDKQENSIKPTAPRATQLNAAPSVQDSEAILTRLAAELTYAPRGGIYKQFIDFYVSEVVKETWTRFAEDYLKQKYFGRWKSTWESARQARWEAARHKERLAEKGRQVRERARRRLEASQRGEPDDSAPATGRNKKQKDMMKSLKQSARNGWRSQDQAKPGSKRAGSDLAVQSTNGTDPKRLKELTSIDSPERTTKLVPAEARKADVLRRSSFLAFSLPSDAVNHAPTTQSTYFRMKALGIHKLHETSNSSQPRGTKRMRSESFGSGSVRSSTRDALSFLDPASRRSQDADAMPPPSVRSVRSRTNDDDDALFARLRAAREALKEGAEFIKDETEKEEFHRSLSRSQSSNESPSMTRARVEARLRASSRAPSDFGASTSRRDVPAYRLRQSRFLSAEDQARAIERAHEIRASRGSRESSRPQSIAGGAVQSSAMGKTPSGASKVDPTAAGTVEGKKQSPNGTRGGLTNGLFGALANPVNSTSNNSSGDRRSPNGQQTGHVRNPFTESSSFAPPPSSGNPFLPTGTPNRIGAPPGRVQQEPNGRSLHIPPSASFVTAPSRLIVEEPQDHTIAPSQIPEALSQSFSQSHPWARENFHFDTTLEHSTAPQTNSFIPLNGQSETISLLCDDVEEGDAAGNTAYGQQQYFGNNLQLTNTISHADDSEAQLTNDALDAALQGTYGNPNSYAILAEEADQLAVQYAEGDVASEERIEEYGERTSQGEPASFGSYNDDTDFKSESDGHAQRAYAGNSDEDDALEEDHSGYEEDADEEDEDEDLDDEGSVKDEDLEEEEYFANYAYKQHTQNESRNPALPDGGNTAEEAIELSD